VQLKKGEFCIVYPEDPHAPAISNGKIRKLIGKVKVNL
jgi:beta-galactosidase beta subunit